MPLYLIFPCTGCFLAKERSHKGLGFRPKLLGKGNFRLSDLILVTWDTYIKDLDLVFCTSMYIVGLYIFFLGGWMFSKNGKKW